MDILIAEDDLVSRRLLQATLSKWGYDVIACSDGDEAWQIVKSGDFPRLMILDWMMPGVDGVELCKRIRKYESNMYVYIILLTAKVQKEDVVMGLEAGADDYITKPFNKQELQVRLRAGRRIVDLQDQLLATYDKLKEQATHDPLTGVYNRSVIGEILDNEIMRATRENGALSVAMLDLDKFKDTNDNYGHLAGDSVLRETAKRMKFTVRSYDYISRYGGEEFLLIFPGCDDHEVIELAERIRESIACKKMDTSEGMIPVTASLGVATTERGKWVDPERLIAAADAAMYRAKRDGRNKVDSAGIVTSEKPVK